VPLTIDILPPPFAWIDIPAGPVTIDGEKTSLIKERATFDVPEFSIAKYPITNAQYHVFVEVGGYKHKSWWIQEIWQAQSQSLRDKKESWHLVEKYADAYTDYQYPYNHFSGPDQPIMGVSWYEAMAFCAGLRDITGEMIHLPSEQQWQRAAQGDDGRKFPWGSTWKGFRCNNRVKPFTSDRTTPVYQYEGLGDSPYGVVDMVGNEWEWCDTAWEDTENDFYGTGKAVYAVRGGSWRYYIPTYLRTINRMAFSATYISGFRIARSSNS
jgi:formylglycine-generating enzyme required for sulfatase activity